MKIKCPKCGITYSVKKYEKEIIKCNDCQSLYFQEHCDLDKSILDFITPKK